MKHRHLKRILGLVALSLHSHVQGQTPINSNLTQAFPKTDRIVPFRLSDEGVSRPIRWGLDTAWSYDQNIKRGIAFMGTENIDIARASFQATFPLKDNELQPEQIQDLNTRLDLIDLTGKIHK